MRDLKFRAFFKADKRIYEVASIDFANKEATLWDEETGVSFEASFDEINLMQYTGLKDRNGREICESDILKDAGGDIYEVRYAYAAFNARFSCCEISFLCYVRNPLVVGNIYENPNLEIK